jgi:LPXTG-motif cell wall-anchored protein
VVARNETTRRLPSLLPRTAAIAALGATLALSTALPALGISPDDRASDVRRAAPMATSGVIFQVVPGAPTPSQNTPTPNTPTPIRPTATTPHGKLPTTGTSPTIVSLLGLGALLVLIGGVVTVARRRLDRQPPHD